MKKNLLLIVIALCFSSLLFSQSGQNIFSNNTSSKHFYFGLGFSEGIFFPGDVNDYMKNTSNYTITEGVEDLFLNMVGRVSFTILLSENIDLSLIGEYAWGPKFVLVDGGDNVYYHFDRFSPGLIAKFHIPIKSGKNSFFLAPGITFNNMKFEQFKAAGFGAKAQAGFSFNFKKFRLQPFLCYDYAKAVDDSDRHYGEFELNYSGVQIGVDFLF